MRFDFSKLTPVQIEELSDFLSRWRDLHNQRRDILRQNMTEKSRTLEYIRDGMKKEIDSIEQEVGYVVLSLLDKIECDS